MSIFQPMLKRLYIKNFAIISETEISFHDNLNILTGETGAGKSILLGAIGLIIGDRALTETIRHGQERAIVEAELELPSTLKKLNSIFEDAQIDVPNGLLKIRREISIKGQNRILLNDQLTTLQTLKLIGEQLIDLHGQHEHQSLLHPDRQLQFLDEYAQLTEDVESFKLLYSQFHDKKKKLKELEKRQSELKEKQTLFEFQVKEITDINPMIGEDDLLDLEYSKLDNAEFLQTTSAELSFLIDGETEGNLYQQLIHMKKKMTEMTIMDKSIAEYEKEFESTIISIKEVSRFFSKYSEHIEVNPERLLFVKQRIDAINQLKKKYGPSLTDVIETKEKLVRELSGELNVNQSINDLKNEVTEIHKKVTKSAENLSKKRTQSAIPLAKQIIQYLSELGMPNASFSIRLQREESVLSEFIYEGQKVVCTESGWDGVEFFMSANIGEPEKPMAKIASGGEISRVMLAIKASAAQKGGIGVLIFDEIDTGVSGKIAFAVGNLLTRLSQHHQVFVITHLPQVASIPGTHFLVSKSVKANQTETQVLLLDETSRAKEIAKLLSGEQLTDSSLQHAESLLQQKRL